MHVVLPQSAVVMTDSQDNIVHLEVYWVYNSPKSSLYSINFKVQIASGATLSPADENIYFGLY